MPSKHSQTRGVRVEAHAPGDDGLTLKRCAVQGLKGGSADRTFTFPGRTKQSSMQCHMMLMLCIRQPAAHLALNTATRGYCPQRRPCLQPPLAAAALPADHHWCTAAVPAATAAADSACCCGRSMPIARLCKHFALLLFAVHRPTTTVMIDSGEAMSSANAGLSTYCSASTCGHQLQVAYCHVYCAMRICCICWDPIDDSSRLFLLSAVQHCGSLRAIACRMSSIVCCPPCPHCLKQSSGISQYTICCCH